MQKSVKNFIFTNRDFNDKYKNTYKIYGCCFIPFLLIFFGCNTKKIAVETHEQEKIRLAIEKKIDNKNWKIFVNTASPLATNNLDRLGLLPLGSTANRILLDGSDFAELKNDSLRLELPFFGTQQISTNYVRGISGFRFESKVLDYKNWYDSKKKNYTIRLKTNRTQESITLVVKVFSNAKATISLSSSHRTTINFNGSLKLE